MLTTDFSGTYDYEKEQAEHEAHEIIDDQLSGYYRDKREFLDAIDKTLKHWKKVLDMPGSYQDFENHFYSIIKNTLGPI